MAEEINFVDSKDALVCVDDQSVVCQPLKKVLKITLVLSRAVAGHQDVIKVDKDTRHASTYSVHQALEGLSCILKAKRHSKELPKSEWGNNGCFWNVFRSYRNLVVATN